MSTSVVCFVLPLTQDARDRIAGGTMSKPRACCLLSVRTFKYPWVGMRMRPMALSRPSTVTCIIHRLGIGHEVCCLRIEYELSLSEPLTYDSGSMFQARRSPIQSR